MLSWVPRRQAFPLWPHRPAACDFEPFLSWGHLCLVSPDSKFHEDREWDREPQEPPPPAPSAQHTVPLCRKHPANSQGPALADWEQPRQQSSREE